MHAYVRPCSSVSMVLQSIQLCDDIVCNSLNIVNKIHPYSRTLLSCGVLWLQQGVVALGRVVVLGAAEVFVMVLKGGLVGHVTGQF